MRRLLTLGWCLIVAGGLVGSCSSDEPANPANVTTGGGAGAGGGGTGGTTDAGGLVPCLDRPDELPRPPMNELPCELLPPGFTR